ncbi:AraC family transcriptional regulator [Sphingobacterium sp. N143]|uniref:AraC family transcriptional regulator n=1 Tax=Sphingobacterium sp. N143 TaxID=2746727 RepID=UPI0025762C53|nr:helix-turn-helix domain-containing protein [Sphingobacterium sp. N143]MDM1294457.1 AraC family transcriptional regulator [Sphingobacterium sp. N143]
METQHIVPPKSIALFVRAILVFESHEEHTVRLPFFADGYPGLMYQQANGDLIIAPHDKKMPAVFLYGQTIRPITLEARGPFQLIIFQLYPFVLRAFWGIAPESINDGCHHLEDSLGKKAYDLQGKLLAAPTAQDKVQVISDMLLAYFEQKRNDLDFSVRQVIQCIIDHKGLVSINELAKKEKLNIRTFERRFLKATGISAKQFAKIVQFQASLNQLTTKDFERTADIVFENGFSDQSHFIRVFKAFTGLTPHSFKKR